MACAIEEAIDVDKDIVSELDAVRAYEAFGRDQGLLTN
jgi:hypothetical protein